MTRQRPRRVSAAELAVAVAATEARRDRLETLLARQLIRVRTLAGPVGATARARAQVLVTALEEAEYQLACARLQRDEHARRRAQRRLSALPDATDGGGTGALAGAAVDVPPPAAAD